MWHLAGLWALLLIAYSNSFSAGFVFDNGPIILRDPRVQTVSWQNLQRIFSQGYWVYRPETALYRPLTTLSWLVNYAVLGNGADPGGYHAINLLLHGINVTLVYLLAALIFEETSLALITAALWGVHPLLTESITNIVGRADLLATFGVLAGLLCFLKFLAATGNRRILWLGLLMASAAVGLLSKESAVVLPGVMLLLCLFRASWRKSILAWVALVPPFALWLILRGRTHPQLEVTYFDNPLATAGFWTAKLTAIKVIGRYLALFIWPAHLSADYTYNAVSLSGQIIGVLVLILCVAALVAAFRLSRSGFFFLLFFFITLAPVSNLVIPIGAIMAERFVYLPSIGLAACLAVILWAIPRKTAWIAAAVICVAFTARTYARNPDWHDDLSLWTADVKTVPESAKAHANRGNALLAAGQLQDAIAEYRASLRIAPDYPETHNNLGGALMQEQGRQTEAKTEFETALKLRPQYADAHRNLGVVLASDPAHWPDAVAQFQEAMRIEPDSAQTHFNLGLVLRHIPGRNIEAIAQFQTAIDLQPGLADAHAALADQLTQMAGRQNEAISQYRIAVQLQPDNPAAHLRLGSALARSGNLPEAVAEFEAAEQLDPNPQTEQILNSLRATGH